MNKSKILNIILAIIILVLLLAGRDSVTPAERIKRLFKKTTHVYTSENGLIIKIIGIHLDVYYLFAYILKYVIYCSHLEIGSQGYTPWGRRNAEN